MEVGAGRFPAGIPKPVTGTKFNRLGTTPHLLIGTGPVSLAANDVVRSIPVQTGQFDSIPGAARVAKKWWARGRRRIGPPFAIPPSLLRDRLIRQRGPIYFRVRPRRLDRHRK